jgi:hypothetical protein
MDENPYQSPSFIDTQSAAMSKLFHFSRRTLLYATGWLCLSAMAGWFGVWELSYNTTAAVFGFVLAFNCFWAAIDSLRGRRFARIALDRAILVLAMMLGYWFLRNVPPTNRDPGMPPNQ